MNNIKAKILIVDDDPSWRRINEKRLTQMGFWTFAAEGLEAAKALISKHYFHTAIVDLRLVEEEDKEEGLDVLKALLETGELTPAIVITAYPNYDNERTAFKDYRVVDFLKKNEYEDKLTMALELAIKEAQKYLERREKSDLGLANLIQRNKELGAPILTQHQNEISSLLEGVLRPYVPILVNPSHEKVITVGGVSKFETVYWSRLRGVALTFQIGNRKHILQQAQILRNAGKSVGLTTKQSLSCLYYENQELSISDFHKEGQ
jgi:ActR/RegA family two-component response regulator